MCVALRIDRPPCIQAILTGGSLIMRAGYQAVFPKHSPTSDSTFPWVSCGHTEHCAQTTPRPRALWSPMGFTWPHKTYTQATPRPRAIWSPMVCHLAIQTIHPYRTHLRLMEGPSMTRPHMKMPSESCQSRAIANDHTRHHKATNPPKISTSTNDLARPGGKDKKKTKKCKSNRILKKKNVSVA